MFCSKCGTQVNEDAQFCQKCGSTVSVGAPSGQGGGGGSLLLKQSEGEDSGGGPGLKRKVSPLRLAIPVALVLLGIGGWYYLTQRLPACGSSEVTGVVSNILIENIFKELPPSASTQMRIGMKYSYAMVSEGKSEGNSRSCSAQLTVSLTPEIAETAERLATSTEAGVQAYQEAAGIVGYLHVLGGLAGSSEDAEKAKDFVARAEILKSAALYLPAVKNLWKPGSRSLVSAIEYEVRTLEDKDASFSVAIPGLVLMNLSNAVSLIGAAYEPKAAPAADNAKAAAAQPLPQAGSEVATPSAPSNEQPTEGIFAADCEIVRQGQRFAPPQCEVLSVADGTFTMRNPMRSSELLDGILTLSIEPVENGHELRVLTSSGVQNWGATTRDSQDPSCWQGSDFRVCARIKKS